MRNVNLQPVNQENTTVRFLGDDVVTVANGCVECPKLAKKSIEADSFVSSGLQGNLFSETEAGVTKNDRGPEEAMFTVYKRRAAAGVSGDCPFTEEVESCWRRSDEDRTPIDELLKK